MAKPPREIYTICRLCLCDDEELLSPAIQIMDSSLSIQDIERFTGILLNADNMLNALCSECINKLRESVYFRNTCVSNDVVFKQLFEVLTSLGRHIQSHTNDARYTCPHCPIKMVERSNLLRHINAVHLKKVVKSCEICGKGFTHNNTYISHMRSHHGVGEIYECKLCPKQYKYPSNLRDHVKKAHVFESTS
ncbi:zinc finger protein 77-like [Anopheles nili]|uniref:zinc finger protein 77-like n=1 Tax=Anopheles nili TaxID=185578 RepID=UPI00237BC72D|nr:zinc finger protein 77-like [Anopheles nili]